MVIYSPTLPQQPTKPAKPDIKKKVSVKADKPNPYEPQLKRLPGSKRPRSGTLHPNSTSAMLAQVVPPETVMQTDQCMCSVKYTWLQRPEQAQRMTSLVEQRERLGSDYDFLDTKERLFERHIYSRINSEL